jgi:hypothetical protein
LPLEANLVLDKSNGDECHYNLVGLSDKTAKKFFYANKNNSFAICIDNEVQIKTEEELTELINSGDVI